MKTVCFERPLIRLSAKDTWEDTQKTLRRELLKPVLENLYKKKNPKTVAVLDDCLS